MARVRQQLFQALIAQDISFFDSAKTGELMNRLAADTTGALLGSGRLVDAALVGVCRLIGLTNYVYPHLHPPQ